MKRFLWRGLVNNKVFSKVAWSNVCAPLDHGGLAIKSLQSQNQSLLLKWMWKLQCSNNSFLWLRILKDSLSINS